MTYNWPHSFISKSMQIKRIAETIRAFFFFFWQIGKNPTKKKLIVEPNFFKGWAMTSEKCTRAHLQENQSIYLPIYLSQENRSE